MQQGPLPAVTKMEMESALPMGAGSSEQWGQDVRMLQELASGRNKLAERWAGARRGVPGGGQTLSGVFLGCGCVGIVCVAFGRLPGAGSSRTNLGTAPSRSSTFATRSSSLAPTNSWISDHCSSRSLPCGAPPSEVAGLSLKAPACDYDGSWVGPKVRDLAGVLAGQIRPAQLATGGVGHGMR